MRFVHRGVWRCAGWPRRALLCGALGGAALGGVFASPARANLTTRVSVSSAGVEATGDSSGSAISADGRFVAFASSATNLVAGDTNNTIDVFVRDRQSGETQRVSVSTSGAEANGDSSGPAISADGRYVAFVSAASNLVPGDTNHSSDVFVHDRQTGETRRVSVSSDEGQASRSSRAPAISADGRYVAFQSTAPNLVPDDTNPGPTDGDADIFLHDLQTGETRRVSVSSAGAQASGGSNSASLSADGRYVAFGSNAPDLVPGDTNGVFDVFVHDNLTGETQRVSVSSSGGQGAQASYDPSISADGRYVAFQSFAPNLVADDTNTQPDIFVYDRVTGETRRVNLSTQGAQADSNSHSPVISRDGRHVGFQSIATNLVAGGTNFGWEVFVHDLQTGETRLVAVNNAGTAANSYSSGTGFSADGRYVAFSSMASNLVNTDTNAAEDVFVNDLAGHDAEPPRLSLPASVVSDATSPDGAEVFYPASAGDDIDGPVPITCTPASGAAFPVGTTTVHCTATDVTGNVATGSFPLTVSPLPMPDGVVTDGFESGLAGWNTAGSAPRVALERVPHGHLGGWAARLTDPSAGACTLNDAPNLVPRTAAGTYTARLWVRADEPGQTLRLRLREYSGPTLVGSARTDAVLTTDWQPITVSYTAKAPGASTLDLNAEMSDAAPGTCFEADDASIEHRPTSFPAGPVLNSGFERDLAGWNAAGSAPGVSLVRAPGGHYGDWAAELTNTTTGPATCTLNDAPNLVPTTASGSYTARLWVRADTLGADTPGQTLKLRLREYTGPTLAAESTAEIALTTSWQQVTVTHTPVAPGSSTLDLNAYVAHAPPGTCFRADDATIDHS